MVDNFEVEPIFEARPHKRHQFNLMIDGRNYKGDYADGEIQWLNPHPKQFVDESSLASVENEIHELLMNEGIKEDSEDIVMEPMLTNQSREMHTFKLTIEGEQFKGLFLENGDIQWFYPQPERKLENEVVEKMEKQVQQKMDEKNNK